MIYVLLPAFNEENSIIPLARKIHAELKTDYRIIVVDDGSTDATAERVRVLKEFCPITLLVHKENYGLGYAFKTGFEEIVSISKDEDIVVTMDCDDTHEPKYILEALEKIKNGYDVVLLSRYSSGGGEVGLSSFRSLLSKGAAWFLRFFFPIKGVKEYSCGYRVFKASVLKEAFHLYKHKLIQLPDMGFVVTAETLIRFRMMGAKICEIPFTLRYDQKHGKSKNRPLRTIMGYFMLVRKYWGK